MNNELISREDLNKTIDKITWYHINPHGELVEGAHGDSDALFKAEDIFNAIDNAPTVENEESIYGDGYQDGHKDGYDKGYDDAQAKFERPHEDIQKSCKTCDYYVNKYGYGQCYGQKDAPRVDDNEVCESWKKGGAE